MVVNRTHKIKLFLRKYNSFAAIRQTSPVGAENNILKERNLLTDKKVVLVIIGRFHPYYSLWWQSLDVKYWKWIIIFVLLHQLSLNSYIFI